MASPVTPTKKKYMYMHTNTFSLSTETFSNTYNFVNKYCQAVLSDNFASQYCLQKFLNLKY